MQNMDNNFVNTAGVTDGGCQVGESTVKYIYVPSIQGGIPGLDSSLIMQGKSSPQIDYLRLLRAVKKNFVYIILCAMIAGVIGFAYSLMFFTPQYESSVSMFINGGSVSVGGSSVSISSLTAEISAGNKMKSTFSFVLNSRTTLNEIIDEAGLHYNYSQLAGKIRTEPVADTAALIIYATSIDPHESELIANTTAEVLQRRIADVVEGCSVKIIDYAVVPTSRDTADYTLNTLLGILIGALLSMAAIVAIAYLTERKDTAVRSVDDFKSAFPNIPVLGSVPDMTIKVKGKNYYNYKEG